MLENEFDKLRRKFRYEDSIYNILAPHVNGGRVLSIGCGQGVVESRLKETKNVDIQGVEVTHYKKQLIKTTHYDGTNIPFPKNKFKTSIISYMLHHHTNIEQILSEAARVTRKSILILDHTYTNPVARILLNTYDYLANIPYNMPIPLNFLKIEEWKELFRKTGLEIEEIRIPAKLSVFFRLKV